MSRDYIQVTLLCLTAVLIGLDSKISYSRMRIYGPEIELNPLVRYLAKNLSLTKAILGLCLMNLGLLLVVSRFPTLLAILFGAKLALAMLQIKSLELKNE